MDAGRFAHFQKINDGGEDFGGLNQGVEALSSPDSLGVTDDQRNPDQFLIETRLGFFDIPVLAEGLSLTDGSGGRI